VLLFSAKLEMRRKLNKQIVNITITPGVLTDFMHGSARDEPIGTL